MGNADHAGPAAGVDLPQRRTARPSAPQAGKSHRGRPR